MNSNQPIGNYGLIPNLIINTSEAMHQVVTQGSQQKRKHKEKTKWDVRIYSHPINYHYNIDT